MKKPRSPAHLARKTADAIAIFKDGIIVSATDSFEELCSPMKSEDRQKFRRILRDLNQSLQQSGEGFVHQEVVLIPGDKEIDISMDEPEEPKLKIIYETIMEIIEAYNSNLKDFMKAQVVDEDDD